jgi:hypothetical protein
MSNSRCHCIHHCWSSVLYSRNGRNHCICSSFVLISWKWFVRSWCIKLVDQVNRFQHIEHRPTGPLSHGLDLLATTATIGGRFLWTMTLHYMNQIIKLISMCPNNVGLSLLNGMELIHDLELDNFNLETWKLSAHGLPPKFSLEWQPV